MSCSPAAGVLRVILIIAGVVALLDIPLFFVYFSIASSVTDAAVSGPVVLGPGIGVLGSAVLGALVWWWMAWARRGSASKFAGVAASASATAIPRQQAPSAEGDTERTDII